MDRRLAEGVERLAVLEDPVRRRLYLYVRSQRRAVTREDASTGADVSRNLAAFHLDKLVERGLLVSRYGRPMGRGGPGSGRPPKLYEVADETVSVSVPERRYDVLGSLLARTIDTSPADAPVRSHAVAMAREEGRNEGEARRPRGAAPAARRVRAALGEALDDLGFEPTASADGEITLCNCPYSDVAREAPGLVCGLNQAFVEGLLQGLAGAGLEAVLAPEPDRCCVVLKPKA